jgi:hypothetical protein
MALGSRCGPVSWQAEAGLHGRVKQIPAWNISEGTPPTGKTHNRVMQIPTLKHLRRYTRKKSEAGCGFIKQAKPAQAPFPYFVYLPKPVKAGI